MEKGFSKNIILAALFTGVALAGCKQGMVISDVDYSQPIETVLQPNERGIVQDVEHGLTFSIMPLQYAETEDTSKVTTKEIRMIRSREGYYYITASGYKNVYVMEPEQSKLKLKKKIEISDKGIAEPAFNQRDPYIQLVSRDTGESYALTAEGIAESNVKGSKKEAKL